MADNQLLPLQEHLERSWKNLQKEAPPPEIATNIKYEVSEMQKWIHIALKQVEKSLDLMDKIPTKCF